jgi:hypothetical protein
MKRRTKNRILEVVLLTLLGLIIWVLKLMWESGV